MHTSGSLVLASVVQPTPSDWITPGITSLRYRSEPPGYDESAALLARPGSGTEEEEEATATTGRMYRVLTVQGLLAVRRGDTAEAQRILDRLSEVGGDGAALSRAHMYGLLGEAKAARRALGAPGAAKFKLTSPSLDVLPELRGIIQSPTLGT
jgi:hypothetical protein